MLRRENVFLRQWLVFSAIVLTIGAIVGQDLYRDLRDTEQREQVQLRTAARVVQVDVEAGLAAIDRVLAGLVARYGIDGNRAGLNEHMRSLRDAMPDVRFLNLHDASGRILFSNLPEYVGMNQDFTQREYFRIPKQFPDPNTLYVSPPFSSSFGGPVIAASRTLPASDGSFAGVATASMDPEYFASLLDSVRYAEDMTVSLQHGDGQVFVIVPHTQDNIVGQNLDRPGSFFSRHRESGKDETVFSGIVRAAGEDRTIVQRTIQPPALRMNKPLSVAVSRLNSEIFASWHRHFRWALGLFLAATLMCAAGLFAYQRRARQFLARETLASRALTESEARFRTIFETDPECVALMAPDGTFLRVNPAGLEIFEADSEAQIIGSKVIERVAEEHRKALGAYMASMLRGDRPRQHVAFEVVGLRGTRRWLEVNAAAMRDGVGNIDSFLGVAQDVTARRKAVDELLRSEERLQRAELKSHSGCWELHLDTGEVVGSEGAVWLFGTSDRDRVSRNFVSDIVLPEDRPMFDAAMAGLVERGVPYDVEYRIRRKDTGEIRHVHSIASVDREKQTVFGVVQDVTERKQHEQALRESEARFRDLFENNGSVMLLISPESGRIVDANGAAERFYGYSRMDLARMVMSQINTLPPERMREEMQRAMREEQNFFSFRHRLASGKERDVEVYSTPTRIHGEPHLLSVIHDVTERKESERRLQLAASVFTHALEGIFISNPAGKLVDVNEAFETITGYRREEVIGQSHEILKAGLHDPGFYEEMQKTLAEKGAWSGESWSRRKNGDVYPVLLTIAAVRDEAGSVQNYVSLFSDITGIKEYQGKLEKMALSDPLTGLPNRTMLNERLQQDIAQSLRRGKTLAVVFIDLDGFKEVNDHFGHEMGDKLLVTLSQRFKACLRGVDTVARIGGDEFVVLLPDLDHPEDCVPVLQRLQRAANEPVTNEGVEARVSASIGVACCPMDATDADRLLRHADDAMYRAKEAGKSVVRFFKARRGMIVGH